ncbi:fatty acid desaturase family protein [Kolteria novifilia]|uniref:fatty acid desaturase family protein n=1 Tax=Kolteria novifilia TaxID=2527975 RepID=UPI003AF3BE8D
MKLKSRELHRRIAPLREPDNITNFGYLLVDYLTLAAIVLFTIAFHENRIVHGMHWLWDVPVVLLAIVAIGGVQHRFAGLGHEASHYVLFRNRWLNELASDFLCMFPILATTHQYRLVHLAHHQFTNDWERDPDLANIGRSKMMDRFPMSRSDFVFNYYFRFFLPTFLLVYLWDVLQLSVLGGGRNPYADRGKAKQEVVVNIRLTSVLGVLYVVSLIVVLGIINAYSPSSWLLALVPAVFLLVGTGAAWLFPERAFFVAPIKSVSSSKVTACMRLAYMTGLVSAFAWLGYLTGRNWGGWLVLLWYVPLVTSFAYFMLLRDVYQHANADRGRLTNSRVFFCDPLTRWAVFVYGQDIHLTHHLFPAVPHYRLRELHETLRRYCPEYAEKVVECEGTFANESGRPSILDVVTPGPRSGSRGGVRVSSSNRGLSERSLRNSTLVR